MINLNIFLVLLFFGLFLWGQFLFSVDRKVTKDQHELEQNWEELPSQLQAFPDGEIFGVVKVHEFEQEIVLASAILQAYLDLKYANYHYHSTQDSVACISL